jgi:hypothetical protein
MCDNKCVLSDKGTLKELMKFNLYETNLPYKKCQKFPKLLKRFVQETGIDKLIRVAETPPSTVGGDVAAAINTAYQPYIVFEYKGKKYPIRFTLTNNDGTVIYDSGKGTTDVTAKAEQLHTTRMEIQRSSETKWGAQLRTSTTVTGVFQEYVAIWVPYLIIPKYPNSPVTVSTVYSFRFSVPVNSVTGEYQPLLQ